MVERHLHPPVRLDHVRGLLSNHDDRRVGVAGGDDGHDGGIYHPQPLHAVHPERHHSVRRSVWSLVFIFTYALTRLHYEWGKKNNIEMWRLSCSEIIKSGRDIT